MRRIFLGGKRYYILLALFLLGPAGRLAAQNQADSLAVSPDKLLSGTFANDAPFRTDYYFTQGISANLVLPAFRRSPLNKLLLRPGGYTASYHGIHLVLDCFTPLVIADPNIRYGDRPFASYLYSSHYRILNHAARKKRFTAALDLGFIGPGTGVRKFQTKIHQWLEAPEPVGWKHQVRTDLVLNYRLAYEKQLLHLGRGAELIGKGRASLGTLYTFGAGELLLRAGKMNSYFQNLGLSSRGNRQGQQLFQVYAQGGLSGRLVGYNATLQGGLLSHQSPYTLPPGQVRRAVRQSTAGLVATYKGVSCESAVVWTSPEFDGARSHKWMHFEVKFAL
ncbi:MAG: lipid A-modifier LpxR family protein [Adhaeribacter sp.]